MTFKGNLVRLLLYRRREENKPMSPLCLFYVTQTVLRSRLAGLPKEKARRLSPFLRSLTLVGTTCFSVFPCATRKQPERKVAFILQAAVASWGRRSRRARVMNTSRDGQQEGTDVQAEEGEQGCPVLEAGGWQDTEGHVLLSRLRDTPKDHSSTSEMTGKDWKLGRDAHPFVVLMATGNPWEPHIGPLSRDDTA